MDKHLLHAIPDFVEVSYRPDLNAVYLKWFSEYDETTRVRDAVFAALDYVRDNNIQHWIADVSTSPLGLSDTDYEWVSGDEFRAAICDSPLQKIRLNSTAARDWPRCGLGVRLGGKHSGQIRRSGQGKGVR